MTTKAQTPPEKKTAKKTVKKTTAATAKKMRVVDVPVEETQRVAANEDAPQPLAR